MSQGVADFQPPPFAAEPMGFYTDSEWLSGRR